MPLSASSITTTMQAFRASDHSGYWRPCLDAVESYLVAQEEREGGVILPTDIVDWMQSSQPCGPAVQFALWALSQDTNPRPLPSLLAPTTPQELWGWVDLYRRRPDWRSRFSALGEREAGWRPALENWPALDRLATEWVATPNGTRREQILSEALQLMGLPETTPRRLELLPPPPMTPGGGSRFPLTRSGEKPVATLAPQDAESIGRAMVRHLESTMIAHVSSLEGRIVEHMVGALEQRDIAVREELAAMTADERRRFDAIMAQRNVEVTQAIDERFRSMGIYAPTYGQHFPRE